MNPTNALVLQARCSYNHCLGLWLPWSRWGQGTSPKITWRVWWKATLRVWRGMKVATGEDVIWSLEHCNITDKESQKQGEIWGRSFFNLFSFDLWFLVSRPKDRLLLSIFLIADCPFFITFLPEIRVLLWIHRWSIVSYVLFYQAF